MTSSAPKPRTRKNPEDRRAEILDTAAALALRLGLEKVTMRLVAEKLDVRPGLISHYFKSVDELTCAAFELAAVREREAIFSVGMTEGDELGNIAQFLANVAAPDFENLGKLWLNVRHLSRYRESLRTVVNAQEELTLVGLTELIARAEQAGQVTSRDPRLAASGILVAIDGAGSYVNTAEPEALAELTPLIRVAAEYLLGLAPGTLPQRSTGGG
ncbi:hypothetical protein GCM10027417_24960 [Glutamicibacter endophyticus]